MEMRPFGATGLRISAISFGAGAVGGAVIGGEHEDRVAIMRYAMDLGINWVDTAPYYGSGKSEEHLGQIFRALRDRPYVSTKVRLWPGDFDDIDAAIERTTRESLARLGLERVELLQLHNRVHLLRDLDREAISVEDVLDRGGVADALERLRDRGLTDHIGFTGLGEAEALHALVASGRFESMQGYHNPLNPSASRAMPPGFAAHDYANVIGAASARGMGVLNIRSLAGGAIGGQVTPAGQKVISPGSEPERDVQRARALAAVFAGQPGTLAQQSVRFSLQTPGVSSALIGFSHREQMDEAVEAASMPPLDREVLARLDALYATDFAMAGVDTAP